MTRQVEAGRPFFLYLPLTQAQAFQRAGAQVNAIDLKLHDVITGKMPREESKPRVDAMLTKMRRQVLKDYLIHPLLSGPSFFPTMGANFVATIIRNLWSNGVILCGHFPFGVDTFAYDSIEGETRGEW